MVKREDKDKIQWHPAFQQAIRAELFDYREHLEFIAEYQLTTEPLKMDTLIIKKPPGIAIEKNIGRIFRGHNIVEYKSPEDNVSIDDYAKIFAYTYLYMAVTHITVPYISITLVASRRPVKLIKYLRSDLALTVEPQGKGVYYIKGERFPVQIIITKELPEDDNLWLNALRRDLTVPVLKRVLNESERHKNDVGAYVYALASANKNILKGAHDMDLIDTLLDDPWYVEAFAKRGYEKVDEIEKRIEKRNIKTMLQNGEPYEKIASYLFIPLEKVADIDRELKLNKAGQT